MSGRLLLTFWVAPLQGPPPGAQAAEAGQAPSIVLQVDAKLGELAIFCSGREPSPWWPPPEADSGGGKPPAAAADQASAAAAPAAAVAAGFVNVDGEVALIVVRASGGNCCLTYGAPGMTGAHAVAAAVQQGAAWPGWHAFARLSTRLPASPTPGPLNPPWPLALPGLQCTPCWGRWKSRTCWLASAAPRTGSWPAASQVRVGISNQQEGSIPA